MASRRKRYHAPLLAERIHPQLLFTTGAVCVLLFLLQDSLVLRLIQVVLFGVLATMNGKRIMWGYFVLMVGSITLFHLFQPAGEVLFRFGGFTVTRGAVNTGLFKGFTIIGLVFISLFSIRPNLQLPGNLGGLLARMLWYFERILEYRRGVTRHGFLTSVDSVLYEIFPPGQVYGDAADLQTESENTVPHTEVSGYLFCTLLIMLNAGFIPLSSFLG